MQELCRIIDVETPVPLTIETERKLLSKMNEFFFQSYPGIGKVEALDGDRFDFFSRYHKFWRDNYRKILDIGIDEPKCKEVAEYIRRIHEVQGKTIYEIDAPLGGLTPAQIANGRYFTANQDFRESIPHEMYKVVLRDPSKFEKSWIESNPEDFLKFIGVTKLSQNDKRVAFAKKAASFLISKGIDAYQIAENSDFDAVKIREMLESAEGIGYKRKKADMFIRDMYVFKVWPELKNLDGIDVASDVNTMRMSLRTGIIRPKIMLLSSFLDIFSYQYGLVDELSARAWRVVWRSWKEMDLDTSPEGPCMLDYLVYSLGRSCCSKSVVGYVCEGKFKHSFYRGNRQTKKCPQCGKSASVKSEILSCLAVLPNNQQVPHCPLRTPCHGSCLLRELFIQEPQLTKLQPPSSISILGRTGWESARTTFEEGAGGPMA